MILLTSGLARRRTLYVAAPDNNGLHPIANTTDFINNDGVGRRVMRGVMLLS